MGGDAERARRIEDERVRAEERREVAERERDRIRQQLTQLKKDYELVTLENSALQNTLDQHVAREPRGRFLRSGELQFDDLRQSVPVTPGNRTDKSPDAFKTSNGDMSKGFVTEKKASPFAKSPSRGLELKQSKNVPPIEGDENKPPQRKPLAQFGN